MINGFFGIIILFVFIFQMKSAEKNRKVNSRFPLVGRADWGDYPHYPENWLVPPCSPLFLPKNADFVIFIQVLGILSKLPLPPSPTHLGNPEIWQDKLWSASTTGYNSNWHINLVILQLIDNKVLNLKLKKVPLKKRKQRCYIFKNGG